jgi:DNA-binding MarR family transcriptional regulator
MVGKLKEELKQKSDFRSLEEEMTLNILRTAESVTTVLTRLLRPAELTVTQYNALRILRGAGGQGLMCGEISDRMITKESDITRLLDRLETRGLITRERPVGNRRAVIAKIRSEGLELLASLDKPIMACHKQLAGPLSPMKIRSLIDLLETVRVSQ